MVSPAKKNENMQANVKNAMAAGVKGAMAAAMKKN